MNKHFTRGISRAATLALAGSLLGQWPATSADFSQVQRVYVPSSLLERRIDSQERPTADVQSFNERFRAGSSGSANRTSGAPAVPPPPSKSYTLLPPPPVIPGLDKGMIVPPPPPTSSLHAAARDFHQQVRKAASSPAVQSALKELKEQAIDYAKSGKLTEAKQAVAQALQLTPHDKSLLKEVAAVSVQRAKQLMQTTDLESATKFARQALTFDATNPDAHNVLDGLLQKSGIDPKDAVQRLRTGDLLAARGHNDEAFVEYQTANRLHPSADAHVGMGNLDVRSGHKDLAKAEYMAAEELAPASAPAHRQLGVLKLSQGDIVGANTELSRALILEPHDKDAAKSLVELWQNQVSHVPGANSHLGLARAYQLAGDLKSAQTEYRTVVNIDPENPHLPAARQAFKLALSRQEADQAVEAAHTLESQGAIPEAYEKLNEAVHLSPGDADLRVHQGYLLEQLHRYGDAHNAYMAALKINPKNLLAAARIKELPNTAAKPPVFIPQSNTPVAAAASTALGGVSVAQAQSANVNNLSNFAYALRNHMMLQKNQLQKDEDQAHDMITAIGKTPPAETLISSGVPAATTASAATALPDGLSSSVSSTLARAREALHSAGGGTAEPVPLRGPITSLGTPVVNASSPEMPPLAPPMAMSRQAVAPCLPAFTPQLLPAGSTPSFDPSGELATALLPPIVPHNADSEPPLAPPIGMAAQPGPIGDMSAGNPANVRFELVNANPKTKDVELNVVLRNDGETPLVIPRSLHGTIRYANRKDADVKVLFNSSAVAPHSVIHGIVHVPYDKADPTADLVLPGILPAGAPDRDVHLTANLPARMQ